MIGEFHGSGNSKAGIIDQYVNASLSSEDLSDRIAYGILVAYVGKDMMDVTAVAGIFMAAQIINDTASLYQRFCSMEADSRTSAGNDDYLFHWLTCLAMISIASSSRGSVKDAI